MNCKNSLVHVAVVIRNLYNVITPQVENFQHSRRLPGLQTIVLLSPGVFLQNLLYFSILERTAVCSLFLRVRWWWLVNSCIISCKNHGHPAPTHQTRNLSIRQALGTSVMHALLLSIAYRAADSLLYFPDVSLFCLPNRHVLDLSSTARL